MKSPQRRRPVRPLTIYGFRRGRPKSRRIWLALVVLASLSILPRVLSPIAEKFWGEHSRAKAAAAGVAPRKAGAPEPGSAFASSESQPAESLATVDSLGQSEIQPPVPTPRIQKSEERPARAAVHPARQVHGKKKSAMPRGTGERRLVPAP